MEFILGAYFLLALFSYYAFKNWRMSYLDIGFYILTITWIHLSALGSIERFKSQNFEEYFNAVTKEVEGNLVGYALGAMPFMYTTITILLGIGILLAYFLLSQIFKKIKPHWMLNLAYLALIVFLALKLLPSLEIVRLYWELHFPLSVADEMVFKLILIVFIASTFYQWVKCIKLAKN